MYFLLLVCGRVDGRAACSHTIPKKNPVADQWWIVGVSQARGKPAPTESRQSETLTTRGISHWCHLYLHVKKAAFLENDINKTKPRNRTKMAENCVIFLNVRDSGGESFGGDPPRGGGGMIRLESQPKTGSFASARRTTDQADVLLQYRPDARAPVNQHQGSFGIRVWFLHKIQPRGVALRDGLQKKNRKRKRKNRRIVFFL